MADERPKKGGLELIQGGAEPRPDRREQEAVWQSELQAAWFAYWAALGRNADERRKSHQRLLVALRSVEVLAVDRECDEAREHYRKVRAFAPNAERIAAEKRVMRALDHLFDGIEAGRLSYRGRPIFGDQGWIGPMWESPLTISAMVVVPLLLLLSGVGVASLFHHPSFECRAVSSTAPDGKTYGRRDVEWSYGGGLVSFSSKPNPSGGVTLYATDGRGKICLERGFAHCKRWSEEMTLTIEYACGR